MPRAAAIKLSPDDQAELRRVLENPWTPPEQALRTRIVLRAAEGANNLAIAAEIGVSIHLVARWRTHYAERGAAAVLETRHPGRPTNTENGQVRLIVHRALLGPPEGEPPWTVRRLAEATGQPRTTVHRIWRRYRLQPAGGRRASYSPAPSFEADGITIVGLYVDPPHGALALCSDERLPRREGCDDLHASLELAGEIHGPDSRRPEAEGGFMTFLARIEAAHRGSPLHVIVDSTPAHWTCVVRDWLDGHPSLRLNFAPTGEIWMNHVESWFSIVCSRGASREDIHDVPALIRAIREPFMWARDGATE